MKRTIIIPACILLGCLFFSCQKNENPRTGSAETGAAQNAPPAAGKAASFPEGGNYGYALRVGTSLFSLESDTGSETDKTKWAASLSLGEKLAVKTQRRATWDGKVYDFTIVRRDDGAEGLVLSYQISEGGSLAVVIDEKANLYKSPKNVDVTGNTLPRKIVGAYFPETERDGFVEIRAYDSTPKVQTYRQNYIRLSSLSRNSSDIQSSILLQTAETLTKNDGPEKIRRDALLEAALLDYPDSLFSAEIAAMINPNTAAAIQTESASQPFMTVNDDNINVRDLPDPVAGRVAAQLNQGTSVTVSEQTAALSTVEGQTARWYHITEPVEGWVFGAYLE